MQFSNRSRQSGFTLVELLVVIAIIGVLVSLLLPAVQSAREAARRMQCSNNMKQLGLALHNYHDTHGRFPPQAIFGPGAPPHQAPYHHTWMVMILPFLEQQPLYDNIEITMPIFGQILPTGQPVVSAEVAGYRCPSDAGRRDVEQTGGMSITNYSGSDGYHWHPGPTTVGNDAPWNLQMDPIIQPADISGIMSVTLTRNMAEVTDGLSNTMFLGETDSMGFGGGPIQTSNTGMRRVGAPVFRPALVAFAHTGWAGNETGEHTVRADGAAQQPGTWFVNHSTLPSYITAWGINTEWPGTSSYHPGGVMAGYGDGSVSFLSETIDWGTYIKINGIATNQTFIDPRN